jgi:hypothetical protein
MALVTISDVSKVAVSLIYLEKDREVRACAEAFDRMRAAAALSPAASVELIEQVARELA